MLTKIMIAFVTAAVLSAGVTADALAFSGGVSHVMTHPVSTTASGHHSRYSCYSQAY